MEEGQADYALDVVLVRLSQTMIGLTFDVSLETGWTLVDRSSGEVVLRELITGTSQQRFGDSALAVSRMQLGNEGAARDVIRTGLEKLAALDL